MKILLHKYPLGNDIKLGMNWFKHKNDNRYHGFTLSFHFFFCIVCITYVSDWAEYTNSSYHGKYRRK